MKLLANLSTGALRYAQGLRPAVPEGFLLLHHFGPLPAPLAACRYDGHGGIEIDPAHQAEVDALLAAEVIKVLTDAVQRHLDEAARTRGYDDIRSAVTYAEEPAVPQFQAEGQAFRAWRSLVWATCYQVMADVQAGQRPIPTDAELIAELPALELPA